MTEVDDRVTSGGRSGTSGADDRLFLAIMALGTLLFLLVGAYTAYDDRRAVGRPVPLWEPFVWEFTSGLVLLVLMPLVMALTRRAWPLGPGWPLRLALHLPAMLAFSLVHVTAMGLLRWGVYAGVGAYYDPIERLVDWPYELRKDVLIYAGLVAAYVAWGQIRSEGPAAAASPGVLEVRDGARRHFVPLAEVDWIEAAGNYVELHRGASSVLHRAPLSEMERQLAPAGFVRIHRSRIVRRAAVAQAESRPSGDFLVRLQDGRELAGSRRYRKPLLDP